MATSFSKAGKNQDRSIAWAKQKPRFTNSQSQLNQFQIQPQIKILLGSLQKRDVNNSQKKKKNRQKKKQKYYQPFDIMLSRQQVQPKKDKIPETYFRAESIFDKITKLNKSISKPTIKLKSKSKSKSKSKQKQKPKYLDKSQFQLHSNTERLYQRSLDRKIKGYVDLKRQPSRDISFQHKILDTPAPGSYEISRAKKLPKIKFQKQIRRDYFYKGQQNMSNYSPSYKLIQKRLDLLTFNYSKTQQRKPLLNPSYCNDQNVTLFDYNSTKFLTQINETKLIQFDKMLPKKDAKVPNYMNAFGNKHIAVNISQQKITK